MSKIDELIEYVQKDNRVCPKANYWNELWDKLPNKKVVSAGWVPASPFTLAAVYDITNDEKKDRLISHLRYAEENGVLDEIEEHLKGLSNDQWVYEKDRQLEGH